MRVMPATADVPERELIAWVKPVVGQGTVRCALPHWRRVAVVGLVVIVSCTAHGMLYVNLTGSMPVGVYRKLAGVPQRGDLVVACLPIAVARLALARGYVWRGRCPGKAAPIGKKVVAKAGDTVRVSPSGIAVNGMPIENTTPIARDSRGRTIDRVASGIYVVGQNEIWLLSTYHPLSFDSRYFGPVAMTDVLSRVRPLHQ